ncbi:hypothetical protein NCCP2222_05600 [Sporosarcina sp. NCCP-2222]|nr:hypothetical protein NCCP2222_05600 [Sporosarcina sp. NCCP-2222]
MHLRKGIDWTIRNTLLLQLFYTSSIIPFWQPTVKEIIMTTRRLSQFINGNYRCNALLWKKGNKGTFTIVAGVTSV